MNLLRFVKNDLAQQAQIWVDENIITSDQAQNILAKYDTKLQDEKRRSIAYYSLLSLAGIFLGASLMVIVSHNWDTVPRMIRMISLILITLMFHLAGLKYYKQKNERASNIWFLIGCISYGVSIMLIGQIYHLGEHFPDGTYFWALGSLPFAFLTLSTPLVVLVSVLSGVWLFQETLFFNTIPFTFLVFIFFNLWFCFTKKRSLIIYIFTFISSFHFIMFSYSTFIQTYTGYYVKLISIMIINIGFLTLISSLLYYLKEKPVNQTNLGYIKLSKLLINFSGIVALFIFSFDGPWKDRFRSENVSLVMLFASILMIGSLIILIKVYKDYSKHSNNISKKQFLLSNSNGVLYILCFAIVTFGIWQNSIFDLNDKSYLYYSSRNENYIIFPILANLILLFVGINLIKNAVKDGSGKYFYFGVGIVLTLALVRYFDLIGDYIGGALMFFIASLVMYFSAKFWKLKKIKVEKVNTHENQ